MTDPTKLVQEAYAAFGSGNIPGLLALCRDDIRWQFVGDSAAPYTGTAVGHAQVAEWFGAVAGADHIQAFEPRRFLAGDGHVTVLGWERTLAQPGGREFQSEWAHVWTVEGGRITSFWGILDTEAASRARSVGGRNPAPRRG